MFLGILGDYSGKMRALVKDSITRVVLINSPLQSGQQLVESEQDSNGLERLDSITSGLTTSRVRIGAGVHGAKDYVRMV